MTELQRRQTGIAAIAIILAVVVVAALAGAGVYVAKHNTKKAAVISQTPSTAPTQAPMPTPPPDQPTQPSTKQSQVMIIKEWGVELALDDDTSSLYYYIKPDLPDVAYLSLKTISDIAPGCAADRVSLAAIGRLTEDQQQAAASNPNALNIPGTIHVGSYWYSFQNSHAACTDDPTQLEQLNQIHSDTTLRDTFNTIRQVPTLSN